jgi:glycosyltransferase involved in cell wall biosynthesis
MSRKVACFFAKVKDHEVLKRVEFYAQDVKILEDLGYDIRIATTFSEIRPAHIYFVWWWTWAFFPVSIAKMLGRPVIVTGVFDAWKFSRRPRPHQLIMRYALEHATANVFVSELEHVEVTSRFAVSRPYYVPLIVDTELYAAGTQPREDFILTVGWLERDNAIRKCIPEAIHAAAKLRSMGKDIRFVIAGERGSYYPRLAELAREAGVADRIEFPGAISVQEKISLMQRCKVYLQPSRFEGFGLATLEAMSCGAPVITSPVGAVPEVVGDTAILVDGTSPNAIAEAIQSLLREPEQWQQLSRDGRSRAETLYSYARRRRDLQQVLEAI